MSRLITDSLHLVETAPQNAQAHPTDSSRMLLGLLNLSHRAVAFPADAEVLDGVISAEVLRGLLSALLVRDVNTVRHSRRTAQLAVGLAEYLGWDGRHLKVMEVAALLHDIGKIGIPDSILFKPGRLSPDEADLLALHHRISVDLLQACRADRDVLEIVSLSREFYNSPDGRSSRSEGGGSLHLGARILAVADAYDSLRSDQTYRKGKSHDEILRILTEHSGTQFDGNVVNALARWTKADSVLLELETQADFDQLSPAPAPMGDAQESQELGHICSYLYLLESLYDGFYLVDSDLRFVVWNHGAEELLGYRTQDLLGRGWSSRLLNYADESEQLLADNACPLNRVLSDGKSVSARHKLKHADGKWVEIETLSVPVRDQHGHVHGVVEIFRDVARTNRQPQEYRDLRMAASRDALTGVANRGELESQLTSLVARSSRGEISEPFSVIFADVDHFKQVNDRFGHAVGDEVLIEIARLLQSETYSGELVGRYGGEEFVIVCPATTMEQAIARAERIRSAVTRLQIRSLEGSRLTSSFGVSQFEAGDNVASLLHRADMALYAAKHGGRNRTHHLTSEGLLQQEAADPAQPHAAQEFVHCGSFFACVAADMAVYKLGGFISEEGASLREVNETRVLIRLGRKGLLPFWGNHDERRPVDVEVNFRSEQAGTPPLPKPIPRNHVLVTVEIRPVGWVKKHDVFETRARRVLKKLAGHFAAELRNA